MGAGEAMAFTEKVLNPDQLNRQLLETQKVGLLQNFLYAYFTPEQLLWSLQVSTLRGSEAEYAS